MRPRPPLQACLPPGVQRAAPPASVCCASSSAPPHLQAPHAAPRLSALTRAHQGGTPLAAACTSVLQRAGRLDCTARTGWLHSAPNKQARVAEGRLHKPAARHSITLQTKCCAPSVCASARHLPAAGFAAPREAAICHSRRDSNSAVKPSARACAPAKTATRRGAGASPLLLRGCVQRRTAGRHQATSVRLRGPARSACMEGHPKRTPTAGRSGHQGARARPAPPCLAEGLMLSRTAGRHGPPAIRAPC